MRTGIVFILLTSCLALGCLSEAMVDARMARYATDNARNANAALTTYRAEHHLTEVATRSRGPVGGIPGQPAGLSQTKPVVLASAPERGLRGEEWLLQIPDGGAGSPGLVFASNVCISGDSCGCSRSPDYAFATAPDGHVVVLRLSPRVHEHDVTRFGACSTGCGTPHQPRDPTGYGLPPTDPTKIEVADVPYDMDELRVHCQHETPAP